MSSISSDAAGVESTFSSWDNCMSEAYCKWPAIIGIVIASLIVLSFVWCIARCLCCGAECCCGCLSCCNRCCPSPRRGRRDNSGYQGAPQPYPTYNQYQPPPQPPVYASGGLGYQGPRTATFDVPSSRKNQDALPAMPTWGNATTKHVEEEVEDVEMEKLDHPQAQQQSLLPREDSNGPYYGNERQDAPYNGDVGAMSASPYHDSQPYQRPAASPYASQPGQSYQGSQRPPPAAPLPYQNRRAPSYQGAQQPPRPAASPYGSQPAASYQGSQYNNQQRYNQPAAPSPYASQPTSSYPENAYSSNAPDSSPTPYSPISPPQASVSPVGYSGPQGYGRPYEASIPPSYHTRAESGGMVSPTFRSPRQDANITRKPVRGSWENF